MNLIIKGSPIARPPQTIGCSVNVKVNTHSPRPPSRIPWLPKKYDVSILRIFIKYPVSFSSILLMEILAALQVALKVILREISLLSCGMSQDMNGTKIVGLCFIHRLMVSKKKSHYLSFLKCTTANIEVVMYIQCNCSTK